MRPSTRLAAALSLFIVTAAPPLRAGDLSGFVRTADGRPVPQIVLILDGPSGSRTLVTGPDGRYHAQGLRAGAYTVAIDAPGFVVSPDARVTVAEAEARLDLRLEPAPIRERVVVTATRGDAALSTLGVSVSVLDREQIAEREPSSVLQLLQDLPGIAVARTGGTGSQSSAFVRGGESRFARILVDGVPVNQPGGGFDFGSALPLELDRLEVVRGAASSLYGTDALAGVIHLVTRRGGPEPGIGLRAEAEGGSFAWRRFQGGTGGRSGAWDWNAGLLRLDTDNEEPNSAFSETAGAASVGVGLGERSILRFVLRAEDSERGTPGPTAFGRPDLDAFFERTDVTAAAHLRHTRGNAAHDVRFGLARTAQLSVNPEDSGSYVPRAGDAVGAFELSDFPDPLGFQNDTARYSLGYQLELSAGPRNLLSGGADVEHETGEIGSRAGELLSPTRTNVGFYAQDRVVLADRVYATLGGRIEHNASFGTKAVPRLAVAVRVRGGLDATTFRASAGAGIKEPSFFETFGTSFFAQGNPDLKPERSRTFDVGVEQRLLEGRFRAEATFFHHRYLDQIAFTTVDFETFQGTYVNLARDAGAGAGAVRRGRAVQPHPAAGGVHAAGRGDPGEPLRLRSRVCRRRIAPPPAAAPGFVLRARRGRAGGRRGDARAGRPARGQRLLRDRSAGERRVRTRWTRGRGCAWRAASRPSWWARTCWTDEYQEALGYPAPGRSVRAGLRFRTGS